MSRKLQIVMPDRFHATIKAAAEREEISVSEFIRTWIRDLPEWKTVTDWDEDRDDSEDSDFKDK